MKKSVILAFAVLLIPCIAHADGDPGLYVDFGEDVRDVIAGETITWTLGPANFGFTTPACSDTDTFCVALYESAGWLESAEPPLGECQILDPGYLWWQDITIYVPCDVDVCDYDTLIFSMYYCDDTLGCRTDIPDCLDPTIWGEDLIFQHDTVILHVVESPPSLYILQDSLYLVTVGQTAAYVPFAICNGDPCSPPIQFDYICTSDSDPQPCCERQTGRSLFGPLYGSIAVPGGECEMVYAIIDAGEAPVCWLDTLTIVAWDNATGTIYDTCVQIVHFVESVEVPLVTAPVMTIIVLALILAVAVITKKRAVGGA